MTLAAHNIHVSIGGKQLLNDVSLDVNCGEVLALLGPNGAGKSTLLRVMSGEIVPAAGTVVINGRGLAEWSLQSLARTRAVMMQHSMLSFAFTALDVVMLGRLPWDGESSRRTNREIARAALASTDVAHLESRRYTTLSGGERQRIHLARVLAQVWDAPANQGRYLLFDEPTASLDPSHQHAMLSIARRFSTNGFGVLVVLHDLNLAAQYADRIALMRYGCLVQDGTPTQVLHTDVIEDVFCMRTTVLPHPLLPCPLVIAGVQRGEEDYHRFECASEIPARN